MAAAPFFVNVVPAINQRPLGETATFECMVSGGVEIQKYSWVGSEKIAREERFSYDQMNKILHVENLKEYDNNTLVDCTATAVGGGEVTAIGRIVVLPGDMSRKNDSMMSGPQDEGIPPLTAGGGVVIAFGFILVILAMFGALRWLKKMEMQKQQDMETARNRYSRIEPGPSAKARYNRDVDNVKLGYENEEDGENDDSYEDMLPVVPRRVAGNSPRGSPRGGSPGQTGYNHNPLPRK